MLDLTAQHLAQVAATRIGMLASPAVRITGVFDTVFAGRGLMQVYPTDDAPVLDLIRAVKAGQVLDADALRAPALALLDQGADHILIACTELSLYTDGLGDDLAWSDSLDCLTREIVATARACGG
jgi:aspartate racemase